MKRAKKRYRQLLKSFGAKTKETGEEQGKKEKGTAEQLADDREESPERGQKSLCVWCGANTKKISKKRFQLKAKNKGGGRRLGGGG